MEEHGRERLLWTGVIGSGVVGLGVITGYLDYVLLPALAVLLGLAVYAGARQRHASSIRESEAMSFRDKEKR